MTESLQPVVVLHVSDLPEDLPRAVAAAESLASSRPELRVRIIVNGPALDGVIDTAEPLTAGGTTTIEACEVGMQRRSIHSESVQPAVQGVASALVAIVEAQFDGAAYVRI